MWFKYQLEGLRRLFGSAPQRLRTQPSRLKCLLLLRQLQPEQFSSYSARVGQTVMITVPYPHLEQYTSNLREASQMVQQDRTIPADWPSIAEHRLSLDRFLTSADGYYLQPQDSVEQFKNMATQLCEAMEASDEIAYGVPEHNLRMLTRLLINLESLTAALIEVSSSS
jgi:hypothetical protein